MKGAIEFLLGFTVGAVIATVAFHFGYHSGFLSGYRRGALYALDRCIGILKERPPSNDL